MLTNSSWHNGVFQNRTANYISTTAKKINEGSSASSETLREAQVVSRHDTSDYVRLALQDPFVETRTLQC